MKAGADRVCRPGGRAEEFRHRRKHAQTGESLELADDETRRLADQAEGALPGRSIRHEEPSRGARVEQSHQMCRRFEEFKRVRGRRRIDDLYCESPLRMKVVELCERGVRVGAGKLPAETAVEGILQHAAAPRRTLHKALDEHVPRMLHVEHHRGKLHRRIETRRLQSTRVETGRPRTQPLEPQSVAQPPRRIHRNNSSIESFRRRGQSERCGYCGFSNSAGSEQDYDRPFFEYFHHAIRAATPRSGRKDSIARPLTHFAFFVFSPVQIIRLRSRSSVCGLAYVSGENRRRHCSRLAYMSIESQEWMRQGR